MTFYIIVCSGIISQDIVVLSVMLLCMPVEIGINSFYIFRAKRKLRSMSDLIKVGITGSVGKTSVKSYLHTLLQGDAYASEKSFNTPLGITRSINDMPPCKFFISEMGARKRGQIKQLCDIVHPNLGIITNVSMAHMESFKKIENVYLAKKEMSDNCSGTVIFNIDNQYVKKMYDERSGEKLSVSIKSKADYWATNIKTSEAGSEFVLHTPQKKYSISTTLIGEHNITNIMLATACACQLKPEDEVIDRIKLLSAEDHRLKLIKNANGVNIIDDSYNASEDSIKAALSTLKLFTGRKFIASPGMVEGGRMQYDINYHFGYDAGKIVDGFIIINKTNRPALTEGLKASGCKKIWLAKNLQEAKNIFSKVLTTGDNLLILNDLPDDYK